MSASGRRGPARRDLRLVPIALTAWAAAFACVQLPAAATGVSLALWATSGAALLLHRAAARGGVRLSTSAVALIAVGAAFAAVVATHAAVAQPPRERVRAAVAEGGVVEADATLTGKVRDIGGTLWFDAKASSLRVGRDGHPGPLPVTIAIAPDDLEDAAGLDLGASVHVRGSARASDAGDASVLVLFARSGEVRRPPPSALGVVSALREGFVSDVVAGLPDPGAGLLPGLAVGDTRAVGGDLDAAMKASSLTHLTAVSGANCAIVIGIAYGLGALLRLPRPARVGVALTVLAGFVLLVTPEPSVVRAAAMAVIAMLGVLLGRPGGGTAALCVAAVALLAHDPWLATSYGFLLSAVATGALLLLARPLAEGLSRWMPRALALGVSVPLAAQIACAPIILLLSPEVQLYGVIANMIAAPAAPVATVVGMLACLMQAVPVVASGLATIAWVPSAWIAETAFVFAGLPAANLPWWGGAPGFAALCLTGACMVLLIVPRAAPAVRRASAAVLAVVVGTAAGTVALTGIAGPLTTPRGWSVAMCDIGQGDAVVLRSAGATALVDTGPDPALLDECLSRLGVSRIDLLVVTHFDLDHVGGIAALAGRVGTVLHGPEGADGAGWIAQADAEHEVRAVQGMAGSLGGAHWRVLWPREGSRAFPEGNDASVAIEVDGGGIPRSILLGDLGESAQRALLATGSVAGRYDIVKVSHHGSADQLPALYRRAAPSLGLIGVGAGNGYGHPAESILAELRALGADVARTDEDGLVLVGGRDGRLWLWREHPGDVDGGG